MPARRLARVASLCCALALASCGHTAPPRRVETPAGSPRYRVPSDVGLLVADDAAFVAFAGALRRDLEQDIAGARLQGPSLTDRLFVLAMLDALDGHWSRAVARLDRIAALEHDPAARAMRGFTIRVWADAEMHGGALEAFRAAMERGISALPFDRVRDQLSMLRTMAQVFTPEVCRQLVVQQVGPRVAQGTVSLADAQAIVFQRYAAVRLVPVASIIDDVLAHHGVAPKAT